MMKCMLTTLLSLALFTASAQDDEKALRYLLTEFLDNVESEEMHDRFWAEDLIYTSSSGKRFGKATIMAGFEDENSAPGPIYSAEETTIKILKKDVALVVFKLLSNASDGIKTEYLNSGTFVKSKGQWKVINWQATKIPE